MIAARFTSVNALGVTIRPPFAERAKAVIARSISLASRKPMGRNSTPNDGATDWILSAVGKFHFEPPFRSFDYLVGAGEHGCRDFEAERPGRLEINQEFVLGRRLYR